MTQKVTVNIHRPTLKKVWRLKDCGDTLAVDLGTPGEYDSTVTVFITDEEWKNFVDKIARGIRAICGECGQPSPVDEKGNPTQTVAEQPMCNTCLADFEAEVGER